MSGEDKAPRTGDQDKELDALLNSALQDFDAPPPAPVAVTEASSGAASELMDSKWTEEFIKQAAAQFEENMQSLLAQAPSGGSEGDLASLRPEDLSGNFHKMAEAAARAMSSSDDAPSDFSAAISQTLRNLSEGQENLQNPLSDEDLASMFGGLGMGGPGGEAGDFVPFMQNMMQSLLSKEVLYPALKDIVDKYPAWLEDNAATLEEEERQRYTRQCEIMTAVCSELEMEGPDDSAERKSERFNKILELMQKLQDCGQPPTDLVGDVNSVMSLDALASPTLPGGVDPANCALM